MGTDLSLALTGCRLAPRRFFEAGFQFQFPELCGALKNLLG
jgi:NAD dependent epimerase/dehydratase family enzyme